MSKALVFRPGEGKRVQARGSEMFFKATAANTGGAMSLMERELPPKGARNTPAHVHVGMMEAFYILEGCVDFSVDDEVISCGPREFLLVPGGVGHAHWNSADEAARLLIIHAPALDNYFVALQELWSETEPPTVEQERELQSRFGMEPAD